VKIKNRGSSAYKPDLYGKSIIVERHFNRSGGSSFKLKDENGKIVSTKKGELEDIIDAFALQLDNPMNVLTQDNARQFLNDSNAKDKYKFFLKGTQLEGLRGEYDLLRFNTDSQQNKAETLIADIEALRKQMEVAVKKARQASTVDGMKKRERLLANQIAWARVEDEERVR
jgi:chromosome segregation ATPase